MVERCYSECTGTLPSSEPCLRSGNHAEDLPSISTIVPDDLSLYSALPSNAMHACVYAHSACTIVHVIPIPC